MRMKMWALDRVCISSEELQGECQDMGLTKGEDNMATDY